MPVSIRADEQRMLDRIIRELPMLTAAVVRVELDDDSTYRIADIGAAERIQRRRLQSSAVPQAAEQLCHRPGDVGFAARRLPALEFG